MQHQKYTYIDAFNELQQIVSDIEKGEVNVDDLGLKIQRASELIAACKAKLSSSEQEVNQILDKLSNLNTQTKQTQE